MKPLIGITCSWDWERKRYYLGKMYVEAVVAGGGIPVPLAYFSEKENIEEICAKVDGLIFSGGADVDPVFFGEEPEPGVGEICPERDGFEIGLARTALGLNIPVFGICRGMQVINIAAGGDIFQDIGSHNRGDGIKHFQQAPPWHPTHGVMIEKMTTLASVLGSGLQRVNSYHHQAVKNPAPGFTVSASAPDGVIEAIESGDFLYALGVQCHPETMWKKHSIFLSLFHKLTEAAIERSKYN